MKIKTKFFGEVEIEENSIISFEHGLPGFEYLKDFVLLDSEDLPKFRCLQSIEESSICLLLLSPWDYFKDYQIELSDEEIRELDVRQEYDISVYNVVNVRQDKITTNLAAPIIINVINNRGKQIILTDTKYSIRQEIPCL